MIRIKPVETAKDWDEFIALSWAIYEGDPHWVPQLRIAVRDMLDVRKNPFFKHARMRPVLAYKGDKLVGRVVAVVDDNHNKFHDEKTGFFGFFESVNDPAVAKALLDDAAAWLKQQGMTVVRGPMNPSTNHECGLLVEGYDDPPTVMMTYNPRYYEKLITDWGFTKSKDLFAYIIDSKNGSRFSDRLVRQAERIKKNSSVTVRQADMKNFDKEVERILEVYNDAWERNWGFVPMEPDEFRHMAKDMKMILDPRLLMLVELKGEVIGFGLALPDVNQVFKKVPDGKLLPTGIAKLLWNLKGPGRKKTLTRCRILTLGIKKAYRELGIGPILYTEYFKHGPALGYPQGEASWILEDNRPMNSALELMAGKRTKVYRIYDKAI